MSFLFSDQDDYNPPPVIGQRWVLLSLNVDNVPNGWKTFVNSDELKTWVEAVMPSISKVVNDTLRLNRNRTRIDDKHWLLKDIIS